MENINDQHAIGSLAIRELEEKSHKIIDLAEKIWASPEIAFQETKASQWTGRLLEEEGFTVEYGYAGLPTAIRASFGQGKPVIGFLGEYDALPAMSQKVATAKEAVVSGEPGHGCGHNLLGAAHAGAVIAMKKEMEERQLPGTIVFYGCPAEETLNGKPFMARGGAFGELDLFFAWHPWAKNVISTGRFTGMNSAKFHFKGITAHAGGDPHNGRSALDAVELMNVGANYLREHVTDDVRLHYVITNGGMAPNIVPDRASVWYYIRALSREAVVETYERLINVARGAALMNDTQVEIEYMGGCYNTLQNKTLVRLVHETMTEQERPVYTEAETAFAAELNKTSANFDKWVAAGEIAADEHIHRAICPVSSENAFGSTDVGDVQHIAPGVMFMTTTQNIGAAGHSWHNTACVGSSLGMKGMLYAARVMAVAGLKALYDPAIVEEARAEFDKTMNGRSYVNPIPQDTPIPQ